MSTLLFAASGHDLPDQLERISALPPLQPFSPEAREFVAEFSQRILKLPRLRDFPELATLSHWFRPAAINNMAERVQASGSGVRMARGTVFHLAPSNVDVLFAYAWLMSVLCGNRNVARLSQKGGAQRDSLLGLLEQIRAESGHQSIIQRNLLLTYPHDDSITTAISARAHARIIWGGDATVARIRSIPLAPLAVELAFADRFGVAAFKASAVAEMDDEQLERFAHRFCNDLLWFSQQACSSPRSLFWIGSDQEIAMAKQVFWPRVHAQARSFQDETAALMQRVTDSHLLAAQGKIDGTDCDFADFPLPLAALHADGSSRELQSGYGLVVEVPLQELRQLAAQLDERDQTLVQHGFDRQQLVELLQGIGNRAIDRIVPVGRALDFDNVWDGTDLYQILTRQTTLTGC
ncbi:acyl-CoA reductase [Luteimonas sp. e5]